MSVPFGSALELVHSGCRLRMRWCFCNLLLFRPDPAADGRVAGPVNGLGGESSTENSGRGQRQTAKAVDRNKQGDLQ